MRFALRQSGGLPIHWFDAVPNFGDILGPVVAEFVSGYPTFRVSNRVGGKILAIGSIAQVAREGDTIWGSGAISRKGADLSKAHVLAVRGPLTRANSVGDIPEVFGDPAVLLPLFYQPRPMQPTEIGIIPHYVERALFSFSDPNVLVVDVTNPIWQETVDQICSCSLVYTSSLHGLIVAEAYGVPAIWISASEGVIGDGFKFADYYASTNREVNGPVKTRGGSITKLRIEPPPLPVTDVQPLLDAWPASWTRCASRTE